MVRLVGLLVAVGGCAWGGGEDSHGVQGVDARVRSDGGGGDVSGVMKHVLLSEVVLNSIGGEFVEIVNPTTAAVDLTHYYLADIGEYWQLPATPPMVLSSDFIVQFPASSMLAPGAVATISISAATTYMGVYGSAPTYALPTMIATDIGTNPTLTDGGEIIVLFSWDGTSSLVKDVDMMIAGAPQSFNTLVSKSGIIQGSGTYAVDANTIAAQPSAPGTDLSTKRIAAEQETQTAAGNGIAGHDETSENTQTTWDTTFTVPTPGQVPTTF